MNSYDFGQFLFNTSFLDENQLAELVVAAKNKKATLATKALFLRMVSVPELVESLKNLKENSPEAMHDEEIGEYMRSHDAEIQSKYDSVIENVLKKGQPARLKHLKETSSLCLIQELIDSNKVNLDELEKLLADYHKVEMSPIDTAFAARYDSLPPEQQLDYPLAVEVVKSFHEFASDSFGSTIILLPSIEVSEEKLFGATVKIKGKIHIITGLFAAESVFQKFAKTYNHLVEDINDAYDVVAEFFNIYAGHLTIQMVATLGTEEEPETPRFGEAENFSAIKMLSDWGEFYLYVGKEEFFKEEINKQSEDLTLLGDLSQFDLADFDDNFDEKFKDPFDF